jgi:hypothetical protein
MTNCQSNSLAPEPHWSTPCRDARSILMMGRLGVAIVVLSLLPRVAVPVLAQEAGLVQDAKPLDLLSIRQPDTATDKPSGLPGATPMANDQLSLDQALDQAMGQARDGQTGDGLTGDAQTGEPTSSSPQDSADAIAVTDDVVAPDSAASTATVGTGDGTGIGSSLEAQLGASNRSYGSAKIGRRKISDVGLAAIGVGADLGTGDAFDNLIWRGTDARDAVFLLEKAAGDSRSQTLTRLAYKVVARQSVPPSGANMVAADLVTARLGFLANGGRSGDLAVLAEQLPDADKWQDWQRWLVEHHLMSRNDAAACAIVGRQITQTMDPFWHKANVICQAVQGNMGGARFAADILAANGVNDPVFYGLVNQVLNNASPLDIDPVTLDSLHIVLMDVANRPIPIEGLAVLPKQMAETVIKLKFLGPDARLVSTFDGLSRGLVTARQASKLWRNAVVENDSPQLALARLDSGADALTTALAWKALAGAQPDQRLALVAGAVRAEIVAGHGPVMLPLYAELVRESLTNETAAATMRFDDLGVAPKMAMLLAISAPNDTASLAAFAGNSDALSAARLLQSLSDKTLAANDLAADDLAALDMWHLLPVFDAAGVVLDGQNWLELTKMAAGTGRSAMSLSPVMLQAVLSAAADRRVAETILLANWLLRDVPLDAIVAADAASLIRALHDIGQGAAARALAQEIVAAHLMQRLVAMIPDGTQS